MIMLRLANGGYTVMYRSKLQRPNMIRSKSLSCLELLDNVDNSLKDNDKTASSDIDYGQSLDRLEEFIYNDITTSPRDSFEDIETYLILERKIEKLSELLQEQQNILNELKRELNQFYSKDTLVVEECILTDKNKDSLVACLLHKWHRTIEQFLSIIINLLTGELAIAQLVSEWGLFLRSDNIEEIPDLTLGEAVDAVQTDENVGEMGLKWRHGLEWEIKDALTKFLRSDDLKEQIVSSTEQCVKDVIKGSFSHSFTATYLAILEQSHRRLLSHVSSVLEESFEKLENNLGVIYTVMHKKTRCLRRTMRQHQSALHEEVVDRNLIQNLQWNMQETLQKELREWREDVFRLLFNQNLSGSSFDDDSMSVESSIYMSPSPPQPSDPKSSIIEQLMKSAEINKQIREGNVNGSFEKALSSSDLALVMAACRAADPATVFASPCKLQQSVLLSLIQQLATDMVHDTQLKCRYLEGAIINLNTFDIVTCSHLPRVVGDVRKHLTKFLISYPNHVAGRRVTLIIMAANNLLK